MAKVRLLPTRPDTGGVLETMETKAATIHPSGLQQAAEAVTKIADTGIKVAAFRAQIKKADEANAFTKYKEDLSLIQKNTFMEMSLTPDSDTRYQLQMDGQNEIDNLKGNYKYRNSERVIDFTDTFNQGYDISSRGLWGKLEIEEQRYKLDAGTAALLASDTETELQIKANTEQVLGNVAAGVISKIEGQERIRKFGVAVDTRWFTTNTANPNSDASIATGVNGIASMLGTSEMRKEVSAQVYEAYNRQRTEINESTKLNDEVKSKMITDSVTNEKEVIRNINNKYKTMVAVETATNEISVLEYLYDLSTGAEFDPDRRSSILNRLGEMEDQKMAMVYNKKMRDGDVKDTSDAVRKSLTNILIGFEAGDIDANNATASVNAIAIKNAKHMTLADLNATRSTLNSIRSGDVNAYTQEGKNISLVNRFSKDPSKETKGILSVYSKETLEELYEEVDDNEDLSKSGKIKAKVEIDMAARGSIAEVTNLLNSAVYDFVQTEGRNPSESERREILTDKVMPIYTKTFTRRKVISNLYHTSPKKSKFFSAPSFTPVYLRGDNK